MKYPQRMQAATTRKAITAKTIENVFPVPESRRVVSRARRGAIELEAASLRLRNVSQQKCWVKWTAATRCSRTENDKQTGNWQANHGGFSVNG
jgi:hypothetical protein